MQNDYGFITVGRGTPEQREVPITAFVQTELKGRTVTVSETAEGVLVHLRNSVESGRTPENYLWLSPESLAAVMATIHLFYQHTEKDLGEIIKSVMEGKDLEYSFSE